MSAPVGNASLSHFDVLVIGSGAGGGAVAHMLTKLGQRVLVLEAGRSDVILDPLIHMPAALMFPSGNPLYDWAYETDPEPHMGGRRIPHARGKVLGGSSAVNGMYAVRPSKIEVDAWAGMVSGGDKWNWNSMFAEMKKSRPSTS